MNSVNRWIVAGILCVLAVDGCRPAGKGPVLGEVTLRTKPAAQATKPAAKVSLQPILEDIVRPGGTGPFARAFEQYNRLTAEQCGEELDALLGKYKDFYLGKNYPPEDEMGIAQLAICLAGRFHQKEKIASLLTEQSPYCVWYAYADSVGFRAYHATEGGGVDEWIPPNDLKMILQESDLWPVAANNVKPEDVFGTYVVTDYTKMRGEDETPEGWAKERVGKELVVSREVFSAGDVSIRNPKYRIEYYPMGPEGEVPTGIERRLSNFFGIGCERKGVTLLVVYDPDEPSTRLFDVEVIDKNTVWDASGIDWILQCQRKGSGNLAVPVAKQHI